MGRHRNGEVLRYRAWSQFAQTQRRIGQVRARGGDGIAQQQIAGGRQRGDDDQCQQERIPRHRQLAPGQLEP